jgi:hypothetical protein
MTLDNKLSLMYSYLQRQKRTEKNIAEQSKPNLSRAELRVDAIQPYFICSKTCVLGTIECKLVKSKLLSNIRPFEFGHFPFSCFWKNVCLYCLVDWMYEE